MLPKFDLGGRRDHTAWVLGLVTLPTLVVFLNGGSAAAQEPKQGSSGDQQPKVKLTLQVSPEATFRRRPVMLTCVVEATPSLTGASLVLDIPPGLAVKSVSTPDSSRMKLPAEAAAVTASRVATALPAFSGSLTLSYLLAGANVEVAPGQYPLNVQLTRDSSGVTAVLASGTTTLTLRPEQSLTAYLGLGALGIVLGYLLRVLIKVLSTTTPPAPEPRRGTEPVLGPIGRFVAAHYYQVDCAVTLLLGLAALLVLVKEGHLPENGAAWYGALLLGLGLGLLTNSELITKLR